MGQRHMNRQTLGIARLHFASNATSKGVCARRVRALTESRRRWQYDKGSEQLWPVVLVHDGTVHAGHHSLTESVVVAAAAAEAGSPSMPCAAAAAAGHSHTASEARQSAAT